MATQAETARPQSVTILIVLTGLLALWSLAWGVLAPLANLTLLLANVGVLFLYPSMEAWFVQGGVAVGAGIALGAAALGLRRGKLWAWWLALIVIPLSTLNYLPGIAAGPQALCCNSQAIVLGAACVFFLLRRDVRAVYAGR
jgi:hypothetical protein